MSDMEKDDQSKDHLRLKTLYSIGKKLSVYTNVETSFADILQCAAEGFPLSSAVLIEHWEYKPLTAAWSSENTSDDEVAKAIANANKAYAYFSGNLYSGESESSDSGPPGKVLIHNDKTILFNKKDNGNFITIPLAIDNLPPLGALQLEGPASLDEKDLEFVCALANLVSVALDRYYKTKRERLGQEEETRKSMKLIFDAEDKVQNLESERNLREAFVSLLTHDLRTPLSIILNAAQMIQRKPDDVEFHQKNAHLIIKQAYRASNMIGDLLDANRIRSGEGLHVTKEKTDITGLIKNTLSDLSVIHGNRFIFKEAEQIVGPVDPKALRRIIENISNNAIKYGSASDPVTVELKQTPEEVIISIRNSGNVISAEDQKSLFYQFRRTDSAQGSSNKGWGIGLTLVKGFTEAHGGKVSVSSDAEKGTVFTVALPK